MVTEVTWGWVVNPACAGMILYITPQHRGVARKPRVCGDDPLGLLWDGLIPE